MLLQFLLVLDQLTLVTVKGFLSPLRINLASEEGQRWGVHPEIPDFCGATGGKPGSRCLDLIFLMQVPSSLLGGTPPGHVQHCRTAVLLKTRSCPHCPWPEFVLTLRSTERSVPFHTRSSWFSLEQAHLYLQFGECSL